MKKNGNVLWIAPREEIDERTKKDLEAARSIEQLETLRTQGFQINYAKAEELVKKFTESQNRSGGVGTSGSNNNRFLSERGSAIAEERTNQIFITDTPTKLEEITELLKKLDVPVRQVLIEARIVEARDTFGRSLGVKFGGGYNRPGRGSIGSGYAEKGTSTGNPFVNLPADVIQNSKANNATLALSIFNSSMSRFLSLELSAMESEGIGKIISSPRLLTADKFEAEISQGTEIPFTTVSNDGTKTEWKDASLKLKVTPQITPDGDIIMDLKVNKDAVGIQTPNGLSIEKKEIITQVLVENGGTVVIGGIFEMQETNQINKVPLLGDIPGVGNLFKNRIRETEKREMLVFITPRMVTDAIANR